MSEGYFIRIILHFTGIIRDENLSRYQAKNNRFLLLFRKRFYTFYFVTISNLLYHKNIKLDT